MWFYCLLTSSNDILVWITEFPKKLILIWKGFEKFEINTKSLLEKSLFCYWDIALVRLRKELYKVFPAAKIHVGCEKAIRTSLLSYLSVFTAVYCAEQLWGVWTFSVSFTSSWKYFMDDPAAIRVKLIPCHTLTAAIKDIFHTMYDRRPRGIRTLFLSINYTAFPASISICHRHKSDK